MGRSDPRSRPPAGGEHREGRQAGHHAHAGLRAGRARLPGRRHCAPAKLARTPRLTLIPQKCSAYTRQRRRNLLTCRILWNRTVEVGLGVSGLPHRAQLSTPWARRLYRHPAQQGECPRHLLQDQLGENRWRYIIAPSEHMDQAQLPARCVRSQLICLQFPIFGLLDRPVNCSHRYNLCQVRTLAYCKGPLVASSCRSRSLCTHHAQQKSPPKILGYRSGSSSRNQNKDRRYSPEMLRLRSKTPGD